MLIRAQARDYQLFLNQTIEIVAIRLGSEAWPPFEILRSSCCYMTSHSPCED